MANGVRKSVPEAFKPPMTITRRDLLRKGTDAWFREAIYVTVHAQGRLLSCREAFGKALGITGNQFAVLFGVAHRQRQDGVTIRDLAAHVALAPPHVTTEVGKLIKKGLLRKVRNAADGRSVLVSLSPAGERAVLKASPLVRKINDTLFQDIEAGALATVSAVMRRLVLNSDFALVQIRQHNAHTESSR